MPRLSDHSVFLAQTSPGQEQLLRGTTVAIGMSTYVLNHQESLAAQIEKLRYAQHANAVLVADLASLAAQGNGPDVVLANLRQLFPSLCLVVTMSDQLTVSPDEAKWVQSLGAVGLFAQASQLRFDATLAPIIRAIVNDPDASLNAQRIIDTLQVLGGETAQSPVMVEAHATINKLSANNIAIDEIVAAVSAPDGFEVLDRIYRFSSYKARFAGNEAVDVLMRVTDRSRSTAVAIGRLLHTLGIVYHVAREHEFEDAHLYYRFSLPTERLRALRLHDVIFAVRGRDGFKVKDRSYRGKSFPRCFVGTEAAAWLQKNFKLDQAEAITLGQTLLRLHVIRHVVNEHDFIDQDFSITSIESTRAGIGHAIVKARIRLISQPSMENKHDQVLLPPITKSCKGCPVPRRGWTSLRACANRHTQG